MDAVDIDQAQADFLDLLDRVATGEQITISRNGVAVGKLVPVPNEERIDREAVIEKIKAFQQIHTLGGLSVREMKHEGHKY